MPTEVSPVRTVNRISDILNCFSCEEPVLSLTAISNLLALPRSTVHRLLSAMEAQGFLTREPSARGYQLGYQLLNWGMIAQAAMDLRKEALPVLQALTQATGETSILSVRDGTNGFCLEIVESSQPVRLTMRVGQRLHLHAGASAKVLWAFLTDPEIEDILGRLDMVKLQKNTISDRENLRSDLEAIRQRGYACSYEETDSGVMGISAPVFDHRGRPVAGVGIAAPLVRVPPERVASLAELTLEATRRLSGRLGGQQFFAESILPAMTVGM